VPRGAARGRAAAGHGRQRLCAAVRRRQLQLGVHGPRRRLQGRLPDERDRRRALPPAGRPLLVAGDGRADARRATGLLLPGLRNQRTPDRPGRQRRRARVRPRRADPIPEARGRHASLRPQPPPGRPRRLFVRPGRVVRPRRGAGLPARRRHAVLPGRLAGERRRRAARRRLAQRLLRHRSAPGVPRHPQWLPGVGHRRDAAIPPGRTDADRQRARSRQQQRRPDQPGGREALRREDPRRRDGGGALVRELLRRRSELRHLGLELRTELPLRHPAGGGRSALPGRRELELVLRRQPHLHGVRGGRKLRRHPL